MFSAFPDFVSLTDLLQFADKPGSGLEESGRKWRIGIFGIGNVVANSEWGMRFPLVGGCTML
jgi:hypothetical protein